MNVIYLGKECFVRISWCLVSSKCHFLVIKMYTIRLEYDPEPAGEGAVALCFVLYCAVPPPPLSVGKVPSGGGGGGVLMFWVPSLLGRWPRLLEVREHRSLRSDRRRPIASSNSATKIAPKSFFFFLSSPQQPSAV